MKRILIFYACYGGGHFSAAKSLEKYLNENYDDIQVEICDCMKYISKSIEKMTTSAYREMAKKIPSLWGKVYKDSQKGVLGFVSSKANTVMAIKLKNLIKEKQPDLIISTHPFSSQMVNYLKKKNKVHSILATVMTDFASHPQWLVGHEYTNLFFVSNDNMKEELVSFGVDINKIHVTGIPMSDRFLQKFDKNEIFNNFNLIPDKKTILFFGGGEFGIGKERTIEIFNSLINIASDYQIVAISGKNEKLQNDFEELVNNLNVQFRVKVLGFTDKVPELMSISYLVVTKPGRTYNNREFSFKFTFNNY